MAGASGKSTELLKLDKHLGEADGSHHLVVLVDADEVIDLANEIDVPDILTAIVHATESRVLEAEGKDPAKALEDGYAQRLWTWLVRTEVGLGQVKLTPGQLVAEMKTRPTLRQRVRNTITEHFSTFLQEVREELVLLEQRAKSAGYERITVLFDSLEKLQGLSTNWRGVLQSAEQVFGGGARYLSLPIHVVYTVPPALLNRRTDPIDFLPMVELFDRGGEPHSPGFAVMREIVDRRIPDAGLVDLLGEDCRPKIKQLIERSGGHPRLLVQMLRSLLVVPRLPISGDDVRRLFAEQRERYQAVLMREDLPWLQRIRHEKALTIDSMAHLESIDRALTNNVIFRYANADVWYDLHPGDYQHGMAVSYDKLGGLYRSLGQEDRALRSFERSVAILERVTDAEPDLVGYRRDLAKAYHSLGHLLVAQGQVDRGRGIYERALLIWKPLAAADPGRVDYRQNLAALHASLGELSQALK